MQAAGAIYVCSQTFPPRFSVFHFPEDGFLFFPRQIIFPELALLSAPRSHRRLL